MEWVDFVSHGTITHGVSTHVELAQVQAHLRIRQYMSKRRRGERHTFFQVPKLKDLARHAVRVASGRPVVRTFEHARSTIIMDTAMSESRSTGTQTKRARTAAQEGAEQVGQGLPITVPRSIPHGFNNTYTVMLSYADSRVIPISMAGGYDTRTWSVTSIFDPDVTATGHQPLLRDLWASQYDYYAVLAMRYKMSFYNCAGSDAVTYTAVGTSAQKIGGVSITLLPTTNTADISSAASGIIYPAAEMKNNRTYILFPEQSLVVEGELTPGDFLVDAKDADNDNTWTAVGSNPGVQRYLGVIINSLQAAALTGLNESPYAGIQVAVQLEYDVQFTQMNQSLRSVPS